jgi:hypothetical protein
MNEIKYEKEKILIEKIEEQDKNIKWIINITMLVGSIGFLTTGISSLINFNFIPILESNKIIFFPQGITMLFYGLIGLILSINQIIILYCKIGEGFNEFNKKTNHIRIYRKGFPGKNSEIDLNYQFNEIEAIKLEIKTEIFNTKQKIYLCFKERPDIPIIQINKPLKIKEIENKAIKIASFLNVSIKNS